MRAPVVCSPSERRMDPAVAATPSVIWVHQSDIRDQPSALTWKRAMYGMIVATICTTSGSLLNRYPQFFLKISKIALVLSAPCVSMRRVTYLLRSAKIKLRKRHARLAHFASQPRPAPRRLPHRTALAIPSEAGTWKKVEAVERRTDCAARDVGPRREAARAQASHAHHSDDNYQSLAELIACEGQSP